MGGSGPRLRRLPALTPVCSGPRDCGEGRKRTVSLRGFLVRAGAGGVRPSESCGACTTGPAAPDELLPGSSPQRAPRWPREPGGAVPGRWVGKGWETGWRLGSQVASPGRSCLRTPRGRTPSAHPGRRPSAGETDEARRERCLSSPRASAGIFPHQPGIRSLCFPISLVLP